MRRLACASLVMLLLLSCANNDLADQGERSRAGKKNAAGKNDGSGKKKGKGNGKSAVAKGENPEEAIQELDAGSGGDTAAAQAPQGFGGEDAPSGGIDPSLARAGASAQDPSTDAKKQGITPAYTESTGAAIQGLGKNVRFTLTFGGELPNNLTKDQYMVIAFGITGNKDAEGYALGATCDEKGWHPYAGAKGDSSKFPGRFEVTGNQIIMEVPWSYIRGPRAFEWYASTGWYGKVANQTHWSFDAVPNQKAGKFPG